jgi:hypothetical protein
MPRPGARWIACAVVAVIAAGALTGGSSGQTGSRVVVRTVSTLDPAGTAKLWRQLVAHPRRFQAQAQCRPLRGVFYAQTDWLRLATKLAQQASPCAQYYVSIPPLVSDKTKPRPDQAFRIRALGSNFHALAEIHWTSWSNWVTSTGSTWFDAGVEARKRMADAGYDVTKGDTWAVNEFPSSVRVGTGNARADARDFVRGLYQGDGTHPTRGVVFTVGVGQGVPDVTLYQNNLQSWLDDSAFWTDISAYVSDWSQEVYPDVRNYAVPGAPIQTRRDYLNDYLQHELVLANAGPPQIDTARSYVQSAYSPLANAAWQWPSGYGWTMVPIDQMEGFVSAQTYALRSFSATAGEPQDHWGFAWAPRNGSGLSPADFTVQTGALLDRLAASIRDSGETSDPNDPGSGACGPPGQNLSCGGDVAGARFTEVWKSFRTWTQPVLVFATPPQTIAAGAPSAALTLNLVSTTGAPQIATVPIAVTLSSSSSHGQFSTAPTGPFSPTLTLTIPVGSNAAGPLYYQDTAAGSPVLTASASGVTSGTQAETTLPGAPVQLRVTPASAKVAALGTQTFAAAGLDTFGNTVQVTATWALSPARLGAVAPQTGPSTTFTAGGRAASGTLTATAPGGTGSISAAATVTVSPGKLRVASIRYGIGKDAILVSARVVDSGGRPVDGARVSVLVRRRGYPYFSGRATTAANGRVIYRLRSKRGCYRTTVTGAVQPAYRWDRQTPANRFCK